MNFRSFQSSDVSTKDDTEQKIMKVGMALNSIKFTTSFTEIGWFQIRGKKDMIPWLAFL